jgi:hypothetical protein
MIKWNCLSFLSLRVDSRSEGQYQKVDRREGFRLGYAGWLQC